MDRNPALAVAVDNSLRFFSLSFLLLFHYVVLFFNIFFLQELVISISLINCCRNRVKKCDVTKIQMGQIVGSVGIFRKSKVEEALLAKNHPVSAN